VTPSDRLRLPALAVLASTLLWGTVWIPLRALREAGAQGVLLTTLALLAPLLLLLPTAVIRGRMTLTGLRQLGTVGFLLALGLALYAEALVRGQVARVILLFYLMPVWGTLLARIVLGTPITAVRLGAIGLGLSGVLVIYGLGAAARFDWVGAEGMAVAAGLAWAVAALRLSRVGKVYPFFDRVFVQLLFVGPLFALVAWIPGGPAEAGLAGESALDPLGWILALGLGWMLPAIALTVYGASHLDAGRLGVFLMLEIVVGVVSAALLADEDFGWREVTGAVLVIGACALELRAALPPSQGRRERHAASGDGSAPGPRAGLGSGS
jgi:drug/metabolite transporter (DMT)-like permease